jgi:hypothetical protein
MVRLFRVIEKCEGVSKSCRTGRLKRELQMIQLSATRCSCIDILWVSLASFATITLCFASQRVFKCCLFRYWLSPETFGYTFVCLYSSFFIVLTLGVKRPAREVDHSPPSSAEVKEWVELYLHFPIRLNLCLRHLKFFFAFLVAPILATCPALRLIRLAVLTLSDLYKAYLRSSLIA